MLGREDSQVKINGFRVEPGEIEIVLMRHGATTACVVLVKDRTILRAFVTPVDIDTDALREHIRSDLPHYMVPHTIVALESLPHTSNGKLDRRALEQMDVKKAGIIADEPNSGDGVDKVMIQDGHVTLWTAVEKLVSEAFAEGLGLQRVGLDAQFFELGGQSVLAMRTMGILRQKAAKTHALAQLPNYVFAPPTIFNCPTVRALAKYMADSNSPPAMAEYVVGELDTMIEQAQIAPRAQTDTFSKIMNTMKHTGITSMACRLPGGCDDPAPLWKLLISGEKCLQKVPLSRFDVDQLEERVYVKQGRFLNDVEMFDDKCFGISTMEASSMDPHHRMLLEVAHSALQQDDNPSVTYRPPSSDTGVFVGFANAMDWTAVLMEKVSKCQSSSITFGGDSASFAAGRISYTLGLTGPSMAIGTECSSSLVAVDSAVQSVRHSKCKTALAAGVNLHLHEGGWIGKCSISFVSHDGRSRSFDAAADGYGQTEACGAIVIQVTDTNDDEEDENPMPLAWVQGTAVNQDGRSASFAAPNGPAEEKLVRAALRDGSLTADELCHVECFANGSPLGDAIEGGALRSVFGASPTAHKLKLGTHKSNVGHSEAASGVVGIIKAVQLVRCQVTSSNLHLQELSSKIGFDGFGAVLPGLCGGKEALHVDKQGRVTTGQDSFGASGTNAHAIVGHAVALGMTEVQARANPVMYDRQSFAWWEEAGESEDGPGPSRSSSNLARRILEEQLHGKRLEILRDGLVHLLNDMDVQVGSDDSLMEAGLDSVGEMQLAAWAQQHLGIPKAAMPENLLFENPSISSLSAFLIDLVDGGAPSTTPEGKLVTAETVTVPDQSKAPQSRILGDALGAMLDQHAIGGLLSCLQEGNPSRYAPIVYIYGAHGVIFGKQSVPHFGSHQPIYAMQAPELTGAVKFESLVDRVTHHAAVLRSKFSSSGIHLVGYCFGAVVASVLAGMFETEKRPFTLTLIDPAPNMKAVPFADPANGDAGLPLLRQRAQIYDYFISKFGRIKAGLADQLDSFKDEWSVDMALCKATEFDEGVTGTLRNIVGFMQAMPKQLGDSAAIRVQSKLTCSAQIFLCSSGLDFFRADGDGMYRFEDATTKYGHDGVYGWSSIISDFGTTKLSGHHLLIGAHMTKVVPYLKQLIDNVDWHHRKESACPSHYEARVITRGGEKRLEVKSRVTLRKLKKTIDRQYGIPVDQQQVFINGEEATSRIEDEMEIGALLGDAYLTIKATRMSGNTESSEQLRCQILVEDINGNTCTFRLKATTRLSKLKRRMEAKVGVPSIQLRFVLGTTELCEGDDNKTIHECGLEGKIVQLKLRNVGGTIGTDEESSSESDISSDGALLDMTRENVNVQEGLGPSGAVSSDQNITGDSSSDGSSFGGSDIVEKSATNGGLHSSASNAIDVERLKIHTKQTMGQKLVISNATDADLKDLVSLEDQWAMLNRMSSAEIAAWIKLYPEGQYVARDSNGSVVASLYTQRVSSIAALRSVDFDKLQEIFDPVGRVLQFIRAQASRTGAGDLLLDHVLDQTGRSCDLDTVAAVTRCRDFRATGEITMLEHVKMNTDPGILFHTSRGAQFVDLVPDYNERDKENEGIGVLVQYNDLGVAAPDKLPSSFTVTQAQSVIIEVIENVMNSKFDQTNLETPLMDCGIKSVHMPPIRFGIRDRLGMLPSASDLINYPSVKQLAQFLANGSSSLTPSQIPPSLLQKSVANKTRTAIASMSMRLPQGVDSASALWNTMMQKQSLMTPIPDCRWRLGDWWDSKRSVPGKHCTQYAGMFTREILEGFDNSCFGIMNTEASTMDPQQRILLEVGFDALTRSGETKESLAGSHVGVYIGSSHHDFERLQSLRRESVKSPLVTTGTSAAMQAGRLSHTLGLLGPSMLLDSACSSGALALHMACLSLRATECSTALIAAVNVLLDPGMMVLFSKTGMMAEDGQCKPFDSRANGYVRSEACVAMVLKAFGDNSEETTHPDAPDPPALGYVLGSAVNQDGRSASLTAPNGLAQEAVTRMALARSGVSPGDVVFVEAHGTGTSLGDPVEAGALSRSLRADSTPGRGLVVGSGKSNVGHSEAAAGLVGVIKAALTLSHRQTPGIGNLVRISDSVSKAAGKALTFPMETMALPAARSDFQMVAGISSFGMSGTNVHVVLEADSVAADGDTASDAQVVLDGVAINPQQ